MRLASLLCAICAALLTNALCFAEIPLEDVAIAHERTGCLWDCPAYRVEIRGDGLVTFEGRKDVRQLGPAENHVEVDRVVEFINRLLALHFVDLPDEYHGWEAVRVGPRGGLVKLQNIPEDELGDSVLTLRIGDREHSVRLHAGYPPEMWALGEAIDELAGIATWIGRGDGEQ